MKLPTPDQTATASAPFTLQKSRRIERQVAGHATSDGAGVKLTRVLTQDLQQRLDPFLMLDHFASERPGDYIGGFPDHPHRGFETVTYMLAGRMRHRDSAGNEGLLQSGGVQWMTAGRGVIHSEMPEQEEGLMEGFQLWLNLGSQDKMCPFWYRDIPRDEVPEFALGEGAQAVRVRAIAGTVASSQGVLTGAVQRLRTEPLYLDIHLPPGAHVSLPLNPASNAFVYGYRGSVLVDGEPLPARHMGILSNNTHQDGIALAAGKHETQTVRALLIAGCPLREPIAQHGPFVMNTRQQLMQAVDDYNNGRLA